MSMPRTIPGTETNVTPDKEVPTIPMETMYQGDFRLPKKKASLLLEFPRPVNQARNNNNQK